MEYLNAIWLLGATLVFLSWFRYVPAWLGWLGFALPIVTVLLSSNLTFRIDSWLWWLYVISLGLIIVSWLLSLHRSLMWTGCFLSLATAGMDWIDKYTAQNAPEPFIAFSPAIDLALLIAVMTYVVTEIAFRKLKSSPEMLRHNERAARLLKLNDDLGERANPKAYGNRSRILFLAAMKETLRLFEGMGNYFILSILAFVITLLLVAFNFYGAGTQFNFIVFDTNWFIAFLIDSIVLGVFINYLLERKHGIRILSMA